MRAAINAGADMLNDITALAHDPDAMAVASAQRDEPVSLWKVFRRAISRDSLRGLTAGVDFLESFGRHFHSLERPARKGGA